MLFAAALMIGMSVPSNAFLSDASAAAPDVVSHKVPGQSLAVSADAAIVEAPRDGFKVMSWAEQLRLKYANVSYSYKATTGAIRWPFPYFVPISDGFGLRDPSISGRAQHNGLDFNPGNGAPIYAVADGTVVLHGDDQYGYGNNVEIAHDVAGLAFNSQYSHMQTGSSPLKVGDVVKAGDFIGLVGETGNATGPHLHFEIHLGGVPVDPFAFLTANAVN
jgi:murein DD-endopeptidase MepM/ murein hydrolase activator NlpD